MWEPVVIPHPQRPNDSVWWDKDIWENDLKAQPWIYQIYLGKQEMTPYYMAYQDKQDKHEGECSVRVEKRAGATKEAYFKLQDYPFVEGQTYKISFWYKTADMSSESLNLKIFNVDHPIKNNTEWTHFEVNTKRINRHR